MKIFKKKKDKEREVELKKFKSSYETLMKFSFLTQDEDQIDIDAKDDIQNFYITTKLGGFDDVAQAQSTTAGNDVNVSFVNDETASSKNELKNYQSVIDEEEEDEKSNQDV